MKPHKVLGFFFLFSVLAAPAAFPHKPVEGSAEALYWEEPMTVHDYKKKSDLHSIAISIAALSELQFVRLGDGLISLTARNKKSPISQSLDSLEYAYSKLPQIEPVRRFGQFWDALQLRQVAISDARILGSVLTGGYGGITPIMQVRVYKLVVWIEDVIYDLDGAVMAPVNWGISSLRDKPTHVKSLGYVADGLGVFRWKFAAALKYVTQKIARLGSDIVLGVEEVHDSVIRRKLKKQGAQYLIYSKMPLSVFQENRSYFTDKKNAVSAGTLPEWREKIFSDPGLLPEDIQKAEIHFPKTQMNMDPSREIIIAAEYRTWDKTPRELRKYVITSDEFAQLIRDYDLPSPVS